MHQGLTKARGAAGDEPDELVSHCVVVTGGQGLLLLVFMLLVQPCAKGGAEGSVRPSILS